MRSCFKMGFKGEEESESRSKFMKNGEKLLEEMIASCGGKCNHIRSFSVQELQRATSNFHRDHIIVDEGDFKLYRGIIENRSVSVKKYLEESFHREHEHFITDIVIGSQMSNHNNVLKLIGCCLEGQYLMVVYEYVGIFTLNDYLFAIGGDQGLQPLPWNCRVKVAMNIANAIAYLHTALLRPVVNRDIKPDTIVMDANNVPKLLDFSLSVTIPAGETHVETDSVIGTYGFADPEYIATGKINEKSDVYGFGVLLLMLLTARNPHEYFNDNGHSFTLVDGVQEYVRKDRLKEILDGSIVAEESWLGKEEQVQEFCALALKCVQREPEDRPTIIEVGKELYQMHRSSPSLH